MEITYELCSNCMTEVEMPAYSPAKCPVCGENLLPCSTCYDDLPGFRPCDWTKESGCRRFPNNQKGPQELALRADRKEISLTGSISQTTRNMPIGIDSFVGTVRDFRNYLRAQRRFLQAIAP